MDFFTYTDFVDRDGKFQLQMLKYSAFAPLGRSMSYMLREEAFHMGTGNDGLRRIVEAGIVPGWLIQKYLNKWISTLLRFIRHRTILRRHTGLMCGASRDATTSPKMSKLQIGRFERLQPESVSQRSGGVDRALQRFFEGRPGEAVCAEHQV